MNPMAHRKLIATAVTAYIVLRIGFVYFPGLASSPIRLYGTDFLAPLVLIPLFTWIQVLFGLRSPLRPIAAMEIMLYVVLLSVAFEWVLPRWLPQQVADRYDVLAYCAGGLTLWMALFRQRRASTTVPETAWTDSLPQQKAVAFP